MHFRWGHLCAMVGRESTKFFTQGFSCMCPLQKLWGPAGIPPGKFSCLWLHSACLTSWVQRPGIIFFITWPLFFRYEQCLKKSFWSMFSWSCEKKKNSRNEQSWDASSNFNNLWTNKATSVESRHSRKFCQIQRSGKTYFMASYIKLISWEFVFNNFPFKWISSCFYFWSYATHSSPGSLLKSFQKSAKTIHLYIYSVVISFWKEIVSFFSFISYCLAFWHEFN